MKFRKIDTQPLLYLYTYWLRSCPNPQFYCEGGSNASGRAQKSQTQEASIVPHRSNLICVCVFVWCVCVFAGINAADFGLTRFGRPPKGFSGVEWAAELSILLPVWLKRGGKLGISKGVGNWAGECAGPAT